MWFKSKLFTLPISYTVDPALLPATDESTEGEITGFASLLYHRSVPPPSYKPAWKESLSSHQVSHLMEGQSNVSATMSSGKSLLLPNWHLLSTCPSIPHNYQLSVESSDALR